MRGGSLAGSWISLLYGKSQDTSSWLVMSYIRPSRRMSPSRRSSPSPAVPFEKSFEHEFSEVEKRNYVEEVIDREVDARYISSIFIDVLEAPVRSRQC